MGSADADMVGSAPAATLEAAMAGGEAVPQAVVDSSRELIAATFDEFISSEKEYVGRLEALAVAYEVPAVAYLARADHTAIFEKVCESSASSGGARSDWAALALRPSPVFLSILPPTSPSVSPLHICNMT